MFVFSRQRKSIYVDYVSLYFSLYFKSLGFNFILRYLVENLEQEKLRTRRR